MDLDSYEVMNEEFTQLDQEKREKVFNAAKELFGRFGYRKTTVDEIADLAGISKRTMYQVFDSKEQILAELVMYEALNFRRYGLQPLKHLDDPVEKFEVFCNLSAEYFEHNPFLGRVLADDAGLFSPFLKGEMSLVESGIKEIIARLINEGIQKGSYQGLNVPDIVECIMVLFRGFTYLRAGQQNKNEEWICFILRSLGCKEGLGEQTTKHPST